jgi:hypothetical protein
MLAVACVVACIVLLAARPGAETGQLVIAVLPGLAARAVTWAAR